MTLVRIIIGFILSIVGVGGSVLPILPGPLVNYVALLILQFAWDKPFSREFFILRGIVIVIVTILDYVIPILGTKKYGGTKSGVTGSTIGLVIAVIVLPILGITLGPFGIIWLIAGPFIGAYIGEKIGNNNHRKALKAAVGSFLGFAAGMILKLVVSIILSLYFMIEAFKMIKEIF